MNGPDRATAAPDPPLQGAVFYGWWMVAIAFLCNILSTGFLFYSYGVLFKPVAAELGGSRLAVSMGVSGVNIAMAVVAPFLGRIVDRGGARTMIVAGSLVAAAGFGLLTQVSALWQFNLTLSVVVGSGMVAMGNLAPMALVARWFRARRGTAMGVSLMGNGLAGLSVPLVATWLIDDIGWRGTLGVYAAALTCVLVPLAAWLVVESPSDAGLQPDGAAPPPPDPATPGAGPVERQPDAEVTTGALLVQPAFWSIALVIGLQKCCFLTVMTHLVPWLTDTGIDPLAAAGMLSIAAGFGIAGKFFFGYASDRASPRVASCLSIGLQLGAVLLMLSARSDTVWMVACGLYGFGANGISVLHGVLTAEAFGVATFGRVLGLARPVMLPLVASGAPLAGYIFDLYSSYDIAFQGVLVLYGLAGLSTLVGPLNARPRAVAS